MKIIDGTQKTVVLRNHKHLLSQLIYELTVTACYEIDFPYDETVFDTILNDLENECNLIIDEHAQMTTDNIADICKIVEKWKIETQFNFTYDPIKRTWTF